MKNMMRKFEESDSRIKILLVVAVAYVMIVFGFNHVDAMTTIENYTPAINITVKDGSSDAVGLLVKQATVEEIINDLGIVLGEEDFLNMEVNALLEDNQQIEVNRITYREEIIEEEVAFDLEQQGEVVSGADIEVLQEGENGLEEKTYKIKLQNDEEVSRELIHTSTIKEPVTRIENHVAPTTFSGRLTTYGGDCVGCSGVTAAGIVLNENGANNSGSAKVFYNGGWYYVLAADRSIPFGTVIEISNHNLTLEPVIYGVVLDRGGDITGGKIDIFSGSERGARFFGGGTSYNTQFRIVG